MDLSGQTHLNSGYDLPTLRQQDAPVRVNICVPLHA